jgi:N-acetylmuramoyl-L-alanine amidase
MSLGQKNLHKVFAGASLGFALLGWGAIPCPAIPATANTSIKREAASTQFTKAEEQRAVLNAKAPEKRTLADYRLVAASYRRVYLITPHAMEVPDALFAVGELNTEMGDHFGRSYYQAAVDSYGFLIREYPGSKLVQDAMLRVAHLQKDQLGDSAAATKSFQDFQKKFPRSTHKREVQEALAELALLRNAESGDLSAEDRAPANNPRAAAVTPAKNDAAEPAARKPASGGESAKSVEVPRVQRIKTSAAPDSTEVTIELEDSVQYVSGRISNPDRIYFDLHAARLSPSVARGNVRVSGNLLSKVRVAQNQAGVVRVVLDVNGVQDYAASLLKKPTRLVIELYSTGHVVKPEAVETARATGNAKSNPKESAGDSVPVVHTAKTDPGEDDTRSIAPVKPAATTDVTEVLSTPPLSSAPKPEPSNGKLMRSKSGKGSTKPDLVQPTSAPQPTRDGNSTLTRTLGLKIGRIVIDPGHGGHDTGTIGPTGLMEKDLCLDVALRLGKIIQQKLPGADIIFTRSDDTFIPLEERTHIANESKADLFISIHANSSPDHGARGVETYYLNLKGSPEAMEVAARENAVSQEGVHDLEDLVKQIARTEKIDESKELAEDVQDSLAKRIQKTARPVRNRGVRKAPFVVLIGAGMPSILTEISFLSNPSDEQLLKKPEHRQRVAEGLYLGVAAYLQSLNSMAVNVSGKPDRPAVIPAVEQTRNQK